MQRGTRQADDFLKRLRAKAASSTDYVLSHTEVPPCMKEGNTIWFRTGDYVIYDNAKYRALGQAGAFNVGQIPSSGTATYRYAAYQLLQHRTSGARFLFVSPHLYVGSGTSADKLRQQETTSMINQARQYAADNGNVPIVYAGDMNSNELHNPDGPEVATRALNVADALLVAKTKVNTKYNSANGYKRKPQADGHSIDHVFTEPGIGVVSWGLYLHLDSTGSFIGTIPSDHNPLYADLTIPF
jgi:endonuclease/exonuclease/phosphatase family metal-dependent hydrolase